MTAEIEKKAEAYVYSKEIQPSADSYGCKKSYLEGYEQGRADAVADEDALRILLKDFLLLCKKASNQKSLELVREVLSHAPRLAAKGGVAFTILREQPPHGGGEG